MSIPDLPFDGLGGPPAAGGVIHIVGGGPGDPGYLTLRAAMVLSTCDVVAHDHLSPPEALRLVPDHADRILVGRRSRNAGSALCTTSCSTAPSSSTSVSAIGS